LRGRIIVHSNRSFRRSAFRPLTALGLVAVTSGCALAPRAAKDEQASLARVGAPYREPFAARVLPDLPEAPSWRDVVARTLAASGELEAAYFGWAAAVHRIDRAGAYPNTPFSLDLSRAFSGDGSGFDRTSIALGFDPMENLAFPTKVYQSAKVATADAQAAGRRFVALRFDLRRRALGAWADYGLVAERLRVAREKAGLLGLQARTAAAQVAGGAGREQLLRAESALALANDDVARLAADTTRARASLNALMARIPDASLPPPASAAATRALPADDAGILAVAGIRDPELAVLAREVQGRHDALALARLQYIPDFNPFVGTDGAASQMAGVVISIPTMLREVGAMIRESRADLDATLARYRQARFDRAAAVVAALSMIRDAERRITLADGVLRTSAERIIDATARAYGSGTTSFEELLAARSASLDVAVFGAEARAAHDRAVADLEALLGVDVETLGSGPDSPIATAAAPEVSQ
jgi:outer membrane protein TolC